jgi:very-short-patch-repair endonuclease
LRCAPGVYFANDRPFTDAARVRAAVWGYGDAAAASGLAAAWWHGLTRFAPHFVEVTIPRDSHGRCREGCRVRRRDLDPRDIATLRAVRVTTLSLTAIEAAARRGGGPAIMDGALQGSGTLPEMWSAQMRNKGRYGSPAARRLLRAASRGAESEAERRLIKLFDEHHITGWQANFPVGPYRVDFAFTSDARVAVEVDGWAFHTDPDKFARDRRRQNYLVLHGWQVLRFTWLDLTEYPERVIATVIGAISAR